MNLNPAELLNPIFNALDALIQGYGVYFYLVFVWLALLVIAWIFSGGLWRKGSHGSSVAVVPGIMITMRPQVEPPTPPIIGMEVNQTWDGDNETMEQP